MVVSVQNKILLTVLSVVLMFALFILLYFPARQQKYLLENYNKEVENYAKTVALGVKIALTEQNFEGVQTAFDFAKDDNRLEYVSLIQSDTIWASNNADFNIENTVFKTFPENVEVDSHASSDDKSIVKNAPFSTPIMNGEILLSFSTTEITKSLKQIRLTSLIVSFLVFIIGLCIGYWLSRNISIPVLALRDAANRVGEGDLTQSVKNRSRDEIGELSIAFNKMVKDLAIARHEVDQRTEELTIEKKNSDDLLLNILPFETAEEIKKTGKSKAKHYESVSVLFTDFKDFTSITEKISADKLVTELNYCFSAFDEIIQKHNIEKIKTIGDSYMCVGGLPAVNETHPFDIVKAAIEIREFMRQYKKEKEAVNDIFFDVRIGINTGPVVAGIVGTNKYAYDIWGSTVNIASRLERNSEPGKINVSESFYQQIKDEYDFTPRGNISVKGIGDIPMYFLDNNDD